MDHNEARMDGNTKQLYNVCVEMWDICGRFLASVKYCYDRGITKNETWLDEIMAVWFSGYAYTLAHMCKP